MKFKTSVIEHINMAILYIVGIGKTSNCNKASSRYKCQNRR